jgi:holo-[acyl-carrier protein] synthase
VIGIDLVKVDRIEKLHKRFGERGLQKFLSPNEILIAKKRETIAGFWAVKEAVSKAIGTGIGKDCSFHDIEIYKDSRNAPKVRLSEKLKEQFSIREVAVSITHDGDYAVAVATVLKGE